MSNTSYSHSPEQARKVLGQFVEVAEQSPLLTQHADLEDIINLDVRLALSSLVMQEGQIRENAPPSELRILANPHFLYRFQGAVYTKSLRKPEPATISLAKRTIPYRFRFSRRQYAFMRIDDEMPFVYADNGFNSYSPEFTHPDVLGYWRNVLSDIPHKGIWGEIRTGEERATAEERVAPKTLKGYLNTVLGLTKGLIET